MENALDRFKSQLFIFSFTLGLASTVAIYQPNPLLKEIGKGAIGFSFATVLLGEVITSKAIGGNRDLESQNEKILKDKSYEIVAVTRNLDKAINELNSVRGDNERLQSELQQALEYLNTRNIEVARANKGIEDLRNKLRDIGRFSSEEAHNLVRKTYNNSVHKLEAHINALMRNYPAVCNELNDVLLDVDKFTARWAKKLEDYETCNSFNALLDIGLEYQQKIIEGCIELRVKGQSIAIKYLRMVLEDSIPYEEAEQITNGLALKAGKKIQDLKDENEAQVRAIVTDWVEANEKHVKNYSTNYTELIEHGKYATALLQQRDILIGEMQAELEELRKPLQFAGTIDYAVAGNAIINFYHRAYGYVLDAVNWDENDTGYTLTFATGRNKTYLTVDMLEDKDNLPQLHGLTNALQEPKFTANYQNGSMMLEVVLRKATKKLPTAQELAIEIKNQLQPSESLIDFVRKSYHIGIWGETGTGKTTTISNIIGGMVRELGNPTIRTTVPKIDEDSAKIFPSVNWLGVPNSIFGLLEAALEIQYRISKNEQAYLNGVVVTDFEPIIFFIDEIGLIFSRWRRVNEADLEDVLFRFAKTLTGERLEYFTEFMQIELRNYKSEFAKRLLMFIWQTGRSLRVKSLIAGQNLQPGALGVYVNDLANCAYIALGDSKAKCADYKVKSNDLDAIKEQINLVEKSQQTDKQLQYTGLFCPTFGKSYLSILPPPNTYSWDVSKSCPNSVQTASNHVQTASNHVQTASNVQNDVQDRLGVESSSYKPYSDFVQASKLSKQYQNLDYEGYVQLWASLPKKEDGSVHKTDSYTKVFKVSRTEVRKIYSEFIDYLENLCK